MADDPNPLEDILRFHAEKFRGAQYAARVARLARMAASIPDPLIDDLAELILQLDDTELVGNDLALDLVEVGYCDKRYAGAVHFASALKTRLQHYVRDPAIAADARKSFRERVAWWRMALGRAFELRKWPAIVLTERPSMADGSKTQPGARS